MSDPVILPIPIAMAQAQGTGFRPWYALQTSAAPLPNPTDDPYARGVVEGQEMAAAAFDLERAQYAALIASADAFQNEPSDELAVLIAETVEILVHQIIGTVEIDRAQLDARARQAASLIAQCDAARTMRVHPDDLLLIGPDMSGLQVIADPDAPRGSIRIDCSAGWIEHGTALYLDELRQQLGRGEERS